MHDPDVSRSPLVRSFRRSFLKLPALLTASCAAGATSLAHAAEAAAAEGGKSYGPPWLVIVLVVALGVFITLRPAGRAGEVKRDLKADL